MRRVIIDTDNTREFQQSLEILEDVEKGQPGLMIVWGRAGTGKSTCAEECVRDTDRIYLRVFQDWSPRAMLAALCRKITGSEPRTIDQCRNVLCNSLDLNQRTIFVDEADRLNINQIEHFRDIHDLSGVPIVLIGEEHLYAQLSVRRRIWDRVTQRVEFGPITPLDIMVFGAKSADLKIDPGAAQKLESRSDGTFRRVWDDMQRLEQMARANRVQDVDAKMVDALPQWKVPSAAKRLGRGRTNGNGAKGGSHG